jgi:hypothetical protein
MTREELIAAVKIVRSRWPDYLLEEKEFEHLYERLKEFDSALTEKAAWIIYDEDGFKPLTARWEILLQQLRKDAENAEDKRLAAKEEPDPEAFKSWKRFGLWLKETGQNLEHAPYEERVAAKARFEKEHPNWKPKEQEKSNQPEQIGNIFKGGVT